MSTFAYQINLMPKFSHLHCHTQFSLLDGAANIKTMFEKAKQDGMPAVAITDHGNMFGVFQFVSEAAKLKNAVKPIIGCEFYLVEDRHKRSFTKAERDKRYHQLMLAKDAEGYANLTKLCSLGYIDGLYGKYPRIDKELILKYHKGLIATTCCLGAEVPQAILKHGEDEARKIFKWWLDIFGEDYYIELQRHNMPEQEKVNEVLLRFAKEFNVKVICSNDSHYVNQEDSNAHDILLCINTGEKQSTPKSRDFADDGNQGKGTRFAFWNDQFYFKTQSEMSQLFKDIPEALDNTNEIVDKINILDLKREILLPNFDLPKGFLNQDEFLSHITFTGAKDRYKEITPEIEERLNFELGTIKEMGFAGYFLIVSDFIQAGKDIGVFVGPGRGSAAGSAVAYCIGITNIDPIKYGLLFERFLNPDRKSMPDIDTDFDDEGRQKVIDYVVDKYGKEKVAQIVTYGTMAAKMSIKDVARVMDLPLDQSNALAKLVPDKPGIKLRRLLKAPMFGEDSLATKEELQTEDLEAVKILREKYEGEGLEAKVLKEAFILEGSVRGTGLHAAGIIIAPSDLSEILPVATSKETNLWITQYEGSIIEDAGVLKMDFLGLKTLSILRDSLKLIKENHGLDIDLDNLPLNDPDVFALYQKGETNGTFQFESPGMQKHLRDLKPDKFEDLIAMNALYRPGPMDYIPKFIARKNGKEKIQYDLPEMEEYLGDTYGITVYQEQVMLLSQKLGKFSKGDADVLRKAMGKKQKEVLDKMKSKFIQGATENGFSENTLEKIWTDWEKFASYAFNKSHSTCYAMVAYQTSYLKAHYPAEYMSSVLTHSQNNIDKMTFFLQECQRMGLTVLGPDINESGLNFNVNKKGQIRFGLSGLKGVGEGPVEEILKVKKDQGFFTSVTDLVKRINLRTFNKRSLEALAYGGAFDSFTGIHRAQYFAPSGKSDSFLEEILKFGNAYQNNKSTSINSLFGDSIEVGLVEPQVPEVLKWNLVETLKKEKEITGIYISAHPLDDYKLEFKLATNSTLQDLNQKPNQRLKVAGIITSAIHKVNQQNVGWGIFVIQDYSGEYEFRLFKDDYRKFQHFLLVDQVVLLEGTYEKRFRESNEYSLRVHDVSLLQGRGLDSSLALILKVHINELDKIWMDKIETMCKKFQGDNNLKFRILDGEKQMSISLSTKEKKVNIDGDLINYLENKNILYDIQ
jgi:DNA polymerase III subunit alpha